MVTVPSLAPVKSVPATALPLTGDRPRCPRRRPDRVTVKVMLAVPSVAGLGVPLEIETVGWSSSTMLPVPSASVIASARCWCRQGHRCRRRDGR